MTDGRSRQGACKCISHQIDSITDQLIDFTEHKSICHHERAMPPVRRQGENTSHFGITCNHTAHKPQLERIYIVDDRPPSHFFI